MKTTLKTVTLLTAAMLLSFCSEKKEEKFPVTEKMGKTVIVKYATVQAAFDLTTMQKHHEMMKKMNMQMKHSSEASHYLMITLLDRNSKKPVEDASVKFNVELPSGEKLNKKAEVMSGSSMVHYGSELNIDGSGTVKVKAEVSSDSVSETFQADLKI